MTVVLSLQPKQHALTDEGHRTLCGEWGNKSTRRVARYTSTDSDQSRSRNKRFLGYIFKLSGEDRISI